MPLNKITELFAHELHIPPPKKKISIKVPTMVDMLFNTIIINIYRKYHLKCFPNKKIKYHIVQHIRHSF